MRAYLAAKEPATALSLLEECDPSLMEPRTTDQTHNVSMYLCIIRSYIIMKAEFSNGTSPSDLLLYISSILVSQWLMPFWLANFLPFTTVTHPREALVCWLSLIQLIKQQYLHYANLYCKDGLKLQTENILGRLLLFHSFYVFWRHTQM